MRRKCELKHGTQYPMFGALGIKVDERWLGPEGFNNFLDDMGERPPGMTIGRYDDTKDFTPENVAWMTTFEMKHRRTNIRNPHGVAGLYWNEKARTWQAKVDYKRKTHHLGSYRNREDAVAAIEKKRAEILNEIQLERARRSAESN